MASGAASSAPSPSSSSSSASSPASFSLPPLPYDYAALEPAISGQIMETHHKKHHQTYVNNLNAALTQMQEAQHKQDVKKVVQLQSAINFNGGGHVNHSIFWTNLAPKAQGGGAPPTGELAKAIEADFGGLSQLQAQMTAACLGVQGSGWGWLGLHPTTHRLQVATRANQDALVDLVPLLGIDVWEHAYYYLYGPARADYLKQLWTVVNWTNVQERLAAARQSASSSK